MSIAVPIRDLKDTAKFSSLVESEREVIVTKNGYDSFYCISADQRRIEKEALAKSELLSRILLAETEIANGDYSDFADFAAEVRAEYDL